METYKNLKKGAKIGLAVTMILTVITFVAAVLGLLNTHDDALPVKNMQILANLAMMILIAVYAFVGYKKPHGNSLRVTCLIFAAMVMARLVLPRGTIPNAALGFIAAGCTGLAAILISYIGGRLGKLEQNKILMTVVGVLLTASAVIVISSFPEFNIMRCISNLTQVVCWADIGFAYVARYEQHKAAGLADK